MRKIFTAALLLSAMGMAAQETYQNAELMNNELDGTARYVAMGGAMEALGADISAAGSNPAALGLMRKGQVSVTLGFANQPNGVSGDATTNFNLSQAGVSLNIKTGYNSCMNIGFNFHKSNNFNQIFNAIGDANMSAQHQTSYEKASDGTTPITISRDGVVEVNNWTGSQVDYLYYNTLMPEYDRLTETTTFYSYNATGYGMYRKRSGYIGNYDFLVSGNVKDRVYWGVSATIADVRYDNNSDYTESLVLQDKTSIGSVTIKDQRIIRGTGFNIKAGVIFRPIEANPFRIGLSVETPTWYNLRTENRTDIYNDTNYGWNDKGYITETYNYSIATPWKFGVSLGTTIGTIAALGVSYNVADYSSSKSRIRTGSVYDRWSGTYYTTANNDGVMNGHTDWALRTVHTVKVGAEVKPSDMIALRVGYNYVSPMYMENAYRDVALNSPGTYYASTTDYTNWKDTHRITAGLGIGFGKFSVDLAYQYSMTKGVFMPYPKYNNEMTAPYGVEVKNNRHQMNCTLGYKF